LRNARRFLFKTGRQPAYAFRVFGKRLKAALGYNFKNGTGVLPEAVTLFLTHRCNLQCQMCGQWGEGGITRKMPPKYVQKELGREKLLSLVDEFAIFKPNITLFGGEPLLHPSCLEIINYIKLKKMHCLMITNGSLLNNFAKELVEADLDELNVSLDGDVSLHDTIRGMTGLFAKITSGLESLNRFKAENNTPRPLLICSALSPGTTICTWKD